MSTNPVGRLDLFVMGLSRALCGRLQEKTGYDFWANGGERVTQAFIEERGIPNEPVDLPMTIARTVGILPRYKDQRRRSSRKLPRTRRAG